MKTQLIGREKDREILQDALESKEAELVSVIGRRRVGKTFLIKSHYENKILFELTGTQNGSTQDQLLNFSEKLAVLAGSVLPIKPPTTWREAFQLLQTNLKPHLGEKKKVIFFDELPWLATRRSGFLSAFGYFWNSWANWENIVVVICGSAASWMIQKVVNDRGGLHNRITKRIQLYPFSLAETELFLKNRNLDFDRYEILHLYMAMGGVPHYLKEVKRGKSVVQNIDAICFSDTGFLKNEFSNLYTALFDKAENHIAIIRALATKRQGMTRIEIIEQTKLPNGGGISKTLEELTQSGFISAYSPFGKKKKKRIYRLTDEFSLFYLQFMDSKEHDGIGTWQHLSQTQAYKVWSGYTFESICIKHIAQIKKALGIAGIYTQSAAFYKKGSKEEKGAQIDLVLDRNDHVINLIEMKFYNESFRIGKDYAAQLREKRAVFRFVTNTKKHLSWTMITTYGLVQNSHSLGIIESDFTMDILYEEA